MSAAEPPGSDQLSIKTRMYRRTALVEVRGELDLCTRPQVADVLDHLKLEPGTVRHVVLDLRGLTFMDGQGAHELVKQAEFARQNSHNFAVVRGGRDIQQVLELTAAERQLVLVDEPEDLAPPQALHADARP